MRKVWNNEIKQERTEKGRTKQERILSASVRFITRNRRSVL
jgi:hypothetical protein